MIHLCHGPLHRYNVTVRVMTQANYELSSSYPYLFFAVDMNQVTDVTVRVMAEANYELSDSFLFLFWLLT